VTTIEKMMIEERRSFRIVPKSVDNSPIFLSSHRQKSSKRPLDNVGAMRILS